MALIRWSAALLSVAATLGEAQSVQQSVPREEMVLAADSMVLGPDLRAAIRHVVADQLRDPRSLQDFAIVRVNARMVSDNTLAPAFACGVFNARNGYGGFAGRSYFVVRLEGLRSSARAVTKRVTLTTEDDAVHRQACFDFPPEQAPWVADISAKHIFRSGCLASRRIKAADRKSYWVLAEGVKEGFTRSPAPGC